MTPLYTQEQFDIAKSTDKLPMKCEYCSNTFTRAKKDIKRAILGTKNKINFCSYLCTYSNKKTRAIVNCSNCNLEFVKQQFEIKKSPNHFCSQSCAATYNNKNKSTGNRRSKLEIWLEEQLTNLYPNLDVHYNKTSAIGSELDIYIPSLNLAFELNGIFHYEPIYGVNKLQQIQENDKSKSKACHEAKIDLCIIDTSGQKYVKPSTSQKYLDIIINIINERLLTS